MTAAVHAFVSGLGTGAGLIVAIGAQNAHVLRLSILRSFVIPTVAVCIVVDAVLISIGVSGTGAILLVFPSLRTWMSLIGAAYIFWYGIRAFHRAITADGSLVAASESLPKTAGGAVVVALAFSLLNPHVYLDTVALLGAISAAWPPYIRPWFGSGAATASILWFSALGFAGSYLGPVFAKPVAWKVFDATVALIMFTITGALLHGLF